MSSSRRLTALGAVLSLLIVGSAGGTAAAQPIREYLGEDTLLQVFPLSSTICVGETDDFYVKPLVFGRYRYSNPTTTVLVPRTGVWGVVAGARSSGAVGTLSPPSARFSGPSMLRFRFLATAPGRTSITFDAGSDRPDLHFVRQTVQVEVTACDYDVHTFSIWHISAGFNIVLGSSIDTVLRRDQDLTSLHAAMKNLAVAFPVGGCKATFTASTSEAQLIGSISGEILTVDFSYKPIKAVTEVCGVGGLSGSSKDTATLAPITFQLDAGGGVTNKAHRLTAHRVVTGRTYITVRPIVP